MLKGIRDILKTIGDALMLADAGEMLTGDQKAAVLGRSKRPFPTAPDALDARVVLAGDQRLAAESVERAVAVCRAKNAILDVLYVCDEDSAPENPLATLLPRLVAEVDLDFKLTRRHGDLLAATHAYTQARRDVLMIIISVSDRLRHRAERYRRTGKWRQAARLPAIELIEGAIHA